VIDLRSSPRGLKVIVLDANAFWTEQLFSSCAFFADVLLLKPRDFRAHSARHHRLRGDAAAKKIREGVWEQHFSMPPGWMFSLWPRSARVLARHIRRFVNGAPFVLVITYPQYRSLIPLLRPTVSVYYNLDDYADNWPKQAHRMEQWENETVAAADLTICIAQYRKEQLQARVASKAGHVHHLALGSTPEFTSEPGERVLSDPEPVRRISHPRAGHVGALNWRFDYQFLARVAQELPRLQFVLGGKIPGDSDGDAEWREGLRKARELPNVHFIGWVEHQAMGEYLRAFDVLLMCYSECRFNRNASPAKLWDYLGSGRPVVANDRNPETLLWREVIRIGATPEAFAEAIGNALAEEGTELQERRLNIARAHTWEELSHRLEEIIAPILSLGTPS
jgi:glycosyltransferase involved in cell wall biosynthesis